MIANCLYDLNTIYDCSKKTDASLQRRGVIDDASCKQRAQRRRKRVRKQVRTHVSSDISNPPIMFHLFQIQARTGSSQVVLPKHLPNPRLLEEYRTALNACNCWSSGLVEVPDS